MSTFEVQTEQIELPSKGLLYPKDSVLNKGIIEMKYMTAKEEDILANTNYISNGTAIDKTIKSMITTKGVKYEDILVGDMDALMIAARVLGFGGEYVFEHREEQQVVDLSKLEPKIFDESLFSNGNNEFDFQLPHRKNVLTFKLLTHKDEKEIEREIKGLKKINNKDSFEISTRLKYQIISVDGERDRKTVREFVDNGGLVTLDSKALRAYVKKIEPGVDLTFFPTGNASRARIPFGTQFFWPDI